MCLLGDNGEGGSSINFHLDISALDVKANHQGLRGLGANVEEVKFLGIAIFMGWRFRFLPQACQSDVPFLFAEVASCVFNSCLESFQTG